MKSGFLILIGTAIISGTTLFAQETPKSTIHEAGVNFSSLNCFGLHYKTGSEKTLFRVSLIAVNITNTKKWGRDQDSIENKQLGAGAGFRVGFEKHVLLAPDFRFKWGVEIGGDFQYSKENYQTYFPDSETVYWGVSPGAYLILGLSYTVKEHFVIGAEITPGIWDTYGKQTIKSNGEVKQQTTGNSIGFGFNTGSASLSVAYRFGK